jgi:hypothetical protein
VLEWSCSVKYLGILFDKRLTFKGHIDYACNKATKFIRILYPLICRKSHLNTRNKLLLYKSIFRAILTYGTPVWFDCAKTHLSKLQRVQNKCLKIILSLPYYYETKKLHTLANIVPLNEFCFKINNKFELSCEGSINPYIRDLR